MSENGLMTTQEVAKVLKVTKQTVTKMARDGRLPFVRVGNRLRFDEITLSEYIKRGGDHGEQL